MERGDFKKRKSDEYRDARKRKKVICKKGRVDNPLRLPHQDKHRLILKGNNNEKYCNHSNQF
jgi:hypothetical protein